MDTDRWGARGNNERILVSMLDTAIAHQQPIHVKFFVITIAKENFYVEYEEQQ